MAEAQAKPTLPVNITRSNTARMSLTEGKALVVVGVCVLSKKAESKQMKEILQLLSSTGDFLIHVFSDDMILNQDTADWPVCHCLISFYSTQGDIVFPLHKAHEYVARVKPFLLNDLTPQAWFFNRHKVYQVLQSVGVPVPPHLVVNRDPDTGEVLGEFEEGEDSITLDGVTLAKTFVEKPFSGEDHNINIYYPAKHGGGVKHLFRKKGDLSAEYVECTSRVRTDKSYIYEQFLTTGGTDVKVYTVGPLYAHAEARKAPTVDGKVIRDENGKELRFPVLLTNFEKDIARKVCLAFGQTVCGFDLLRTRNGKSYVCDVNGWSFVKSSKKFYYDAADILRSMILAHCLPALSPSSGPRWHNSKDKKARASFSEGITGTGDFSYLLDSPGSAHTPERKAGGAWEELRCVVAVIRHGDRTPKAKMKIKLRDQEMIDLLERNGSEKEIKKGEVKLKTPAQMQEVLDAVNQILEKQGGGIQEERDARAQLRLVRRVLVRHSSNLGKGNFKGVNRKVQLKVLERSDQDQDQVTQVLFIMKHGGLLTHAGRQQADVLGRSFREKMYPSSSEENGLLRLHSTFRHDLKIYSSEEGRVQNSAAAFALGLLDYKSTSLAPILVSLVEKDSSMLDAYGKGADSDITASKAMLNELMTSSEPQRDLKDLITCPDCLANPHGPQGTQQMPGSEEGELPLGQLKELHAAMQSMVSDLLVRKKLAEEEEIRVHGQTLSASNSLPSPLHSPSNSSNALVQQPSFSSNPQVDGQQLQKGEGTGQMSTGAGQQSSSSSTAAAAGGGGGVAGAAGGDSQQQQQGAAGEKSNQRTRDYVCSDSVHEIYDRWAKLKDTFLKKGEFNISKIPDIYDAVKFDLLHNFHMSILGAEEVYRLAQPLANLVIPSEYGTCPHQKLRIGSCIAVNLIRKIMKDFKIVKEEDLKASEAEEPNKRNSSHLRPQPSDLKEAEDNKPAANLAQRETARIAGSGSPDLLEGDEEEQRARLNHHFETGVKSTHRHVRTRLYFTSESHMHALVNVIRFAHLPDQTESPIVSSEGEEKLRSTRELDYLSHVVFRMFENPSLPLDDPAHFRVEVLFSPGAAANPSKHHLAQATMEMEDPSEASHAVPVEAPTPLSFTDRNVNLPIVEELLKRIVNEQDLKPSLSEKSI